MRVAIVGSGVTGLAATWLLNEYSEHEVHLYEADDRPGGHANTVHVAPLGKEPVDVDTGFIVFNPPTYPNFLRFLKLHKRTVEVIETDMTFSVSRDGGVFEWAGASLRSVFCQTKRVFDPGMWRMLFDIARFNTCAVRVLNEDGDPTVAEYLRREGYSRRFRDDYLLPMTAAVWNTPPDVCATDSPVKNVVRFLYNHDFMRITGKLTWLTIKGGSKKYVDKILSKLPAKQLHLSTPVHAVSSGDGKSILVTATGQRETFDHIIFACHADDALRILDAGSGATPEEREILGAFRWNRNDVWLHSDENLMPRSRLAWSCWNSIMRTTFDEKGAGRANDPQVSLTYWMNNIQHLPTEKYGHLFLTLNPPSPPSAEHTLGRYVYTHPVLSTDGVRAQRRLVQLNTRAIESGRHRAFAGAWSRYGFHEDGFAAGLRAAAMLPGVSPPFAIVDADVELGEPRAGVIARVFDVLNVVRAYFVLIIGSVLFLVFSSVMEKVD